MNQNEQGTLYPFRLSGSRMRQGAVQLRRRGQALDAIALVRRAAEQDDTPAAWHALAQELLQTGNWESAARLLARVLSRDARQNGVWIDMARCLQALDQTALAVDCAYHQLHEDPWSREAEATRAMLPELEDAERPREPRRTQRLIHRGLSAWQEGDRALGERRIRRALRMTAEPERLLVTTAMLCMLGMDMAGAWRYLCRALRANPQDPRTLTALATLCQQMGKHRLARGFLQQAAKHAQSVQAEDSFLASAWAQDAWTETQAYLASRMKAHPHRIPLMSACATMHAEQGRTETALQLWREVLALDPDDRQAAIMLSWMQREPDNVIGVPGLMNRRERRRQLTELQMAAESLELRDLLRIGSRERRLVDWMLESGDQHEMQAAMACLTQDKADETLTGYLKELLCRPFLRSEVRQWALVRLADMGCRDEMLMMTGSHYTIVQCQPLSERKQQQPWRIFLPLLLKETQRYHQSGALVETAASWWQRMNKEQRMEAAGSGRYLWCKAMEILWLRMQGEDALAVRVAAQAAQPPRKISRVLRKLARIAAEDLTVQ